MDKHAWIFTYDFSSQSFTDWTVLVSILGLAHELAYFLRLGDGDCEDSFFKGLLDAGCAQVFVILPQSVIYRQAACVRLTEDCEGLS